ncbi:NAD(P)/FAD-dependent oxidoreductase [Nocardia sp. NPDC127579]|uniref:NAD(P)/FAD-dependent oxidoreductase n=1 Tax=Nocardia sp. NPDC127579 TaxID=3345402 RepID=UPI00362684F9
MIGGGFAGMLAASVLADFASVTIIERDSLPDGAQPRKGLPQARHTHLLWSGGATALEDLLPEAVAWLIAAGARRAPLMGSFVSKSPTGPWFPRSTHTPYANLLCSRDLLDAAIRAVVLARPGIQLRQATEVVALEGSSARITGVRIESANGAESLTADLIVDASGRGSRGPAWLEQIGLPPVVESVVDAGFGYASRFYRAPGHTADGFPVVNIQPNPQENPGRFGVIVPVEGGRWSVTLGASRDGRPSGDNAEFLAHARLLCHPVIGDLLADAEPLTDVATTRNTANRRRYYEKLVTWPAGFVALGDAVASTNPVYGYGMSVAARSVVDLRKVLRRNSIDATRTAPRIQQAIGRRAQQAWDLAIGQDIFYPGARPTPPTMFERLRTGYLDRVVDAAAGSPEVMRTLIGAVSMETASAHLVRPDLLLRIHFARKVPHLADPPLTEAEWDVLNQHTPRL